MSTCSVCLRLFDSHLFLIQHLNEQHLDRPFICDVPSCSKSYKKKSHLKNHVDSTHNNIKFSCTLCDAHLSTQSSLRRHYKNIHERETPFACSFEDCNARFHSEDLLLKHSSEHSGLLPYGCSYDGCDKRFFFPVQLRNHVTNVHEKIHYCSSCSESFDSKVDLSVHVELHNAKLPCEYCGMLFKTQKTLKFHIFYKHSGENISFPCEICEKTFTLEKNLKVHVSRSHLKEKPYECDTCKKKFGYKHSLQRHNQNIHNSEKTVENRKRPHPDQSTTFEPHKRRCQTDQIPQ